MKKILLVIIVFFTFSLKSQVLNVKEMTQEQDQWCWAGVSACILDYYCVQKSQCEIAEYTRTVETFPDIGFGNTDCCIFPSSCNSWNYSWGGMGSLQDILVHFGGVTNTEVYSSLTSAEIISDIQNNKLFVIRWGWEVGGGHFLVGHGLVEDNLYYMDPWFGEGMKIADFRWVCFDGNHTWTHTNRITATLASEMPETPMISQEGSTLYSNALIGNQWYDENGMIEGERYQTFYPEVEGYYYVVVTLSNCVSEASNVIHYTGTAISSIEQNKRVDIYPNPANTSLHIALNNVSETSVSYQLSDIQGRKLQSGSFSPPHYEMNIADISKGIYFISLTFDNQYSVIKKVVVE